jgi:hypothetical protein
MLYVRNGQRLSTHNIVDHPHWRWQTPPSSGMRNRLAPYAVYRLIKDSSHTSRAAHLWFQRCPSPNPQSHRVRRLKPGVECNHLCPIVILRPNALQKSCDSLNWTNPSLTRPEKEIRFCQLLHSLVGCHRTHQR